MKEEAYTNFKCQVDAVKRALDRLVNAVDVLHSEGDGLGVVAERQQLDFEVDGLRTELDAYLLVRDGSSLPKLRVEIHAEPEDIRPEDIFCDEESSALVRKQMAAGNEFAWFCAHVVVHFGDAFAEDYLGGCSYYDEHDFKMGGYYADMVRQCQDELETRIGSVFVEELHRQVEEYLVPFEPGS
jgi:hypothetical protein